MKTIEVNWQGSLNHSERFVKFHHPDERESVAPGGWTEASAFTVTENGVRIVLVDGTEVRFWPGHLCKTTVKTSAYVTEPEYDHN